MESTMLNCTCISQNVKDAVQKSNLDSAIKKQIDIIHTCGIISNENVETIIKTLSTQRHSKTIPLKPVINKMTEYGLSKSEIDKKLLNLRNQGDIYLEVGTPIGATKEELAKSTIETPRARFAYIKLQK